jgi:outer membrane protein OmpA-like peptidoglycan-associated protein
VSDLLRDESEIFRDVRKVASGKAIGTAIAPGSAAVPAEVPAGGDRPVGSFAVGSYELSEVDRRKIRELAELLISDPSIRYVVIEGGADDTGTTTTNRELSQRRAYAVFTELRKYGIPEQKVAMKVAYFVRSSPEVREDDRAKDRRVAVRVFRD